jgi:hypothetical protein
MENVYIYTLSDTHGDYLFVCTENIVEEYQNIMRFIGIEIQISKVLETTEYSFQRNFHNVPVRKMPRKDLEKNIKGLYSYFEKVFEDDENDDVDIVNEILKNSENYNYIDDNKTNYLIYSTRFNVGFIYPKTIHTDNLLQGIDTLKVIKKYNEINNVLDLQDFFKKKNFSGLEDFKTKIESIEKIFDIYKKPSTTLIKDYLSTYYTVTKNKTDKIKASVLLKDISLQTKENMKKLTTQILEELGVQKKRLADGSFFIGIRTISVTDLEKNRERDIQKIYLENNKLEFY